MELDLSAAVLGLGRALLHVRRRAIDQVCICRRTLKSGTE